MAWKSCMKLNIILQDDATDMPTWDISYIYVACAFGNVCPLQLTLGRVRVNHLNINIWYAYLFTLGSFLVVADLSFSRFMGSHIEPESIYTQPFKLCITLHILISVCVTVQFKKFGQPWMYVNSFNLYNSILFVSLGFGFPLPNLRLNFVWLFFGTNVKLISIKLTVWKIIAFNLSD